MSSFLELAHLRSPLYNYLINDAMPYIDFVQDPHQSGMPLNLDCHKGSFVFSSSHYVKNIIEDSATPIYNLDWKPTAQWPQAALSELRKISFKRAIFFFSIEQIPLQLIQELEKSGCNNFIFRDASQWQRIDVSHSRTGFTAWLKRFRTIRTALLYSLGQKINAQDVVPVDGYCYKVQLPNTVSQNASPENLGSDLLLFENNFRLDLSSMPVIEIIAEGKSRFCQQGFDLFFSASDSSDPRFNQRAYRFVDLKGPFKKFSSFFYPLSQRLPEITPSEIDFETAIQDLINKHWQFDPAHLETAQNNTSGPICLFSGSLGPGGTERQLTYVAKHLSNAGKDVHIFTCQSLSETALHYYPILSATAPIKIQPITHPNKWFPEELLLTESWREKTLSLFLSMPDYMSQYVWNLYTHLMVIRPKILHCWLDYPNVVGAMAGWLANVPQIILSTRSVNPTHFPHFYRSWYQEWYQHLSRLPNVKLIANSQAGLNDYSDWLNMPRSRFNLIRNGVDFSVITPSSQDEIKHFRHNLRIEEDEPMIAGIFRLDPEKRPFTFLEVVMKIKERIPKLKVVMAGIGSLDKAVHKKVADLNAGTWVTLLGRRQDVPAILSACELALLTSSEEGTPNILLEAQWLEKPVVCTDVGGVSEIVENGKTGYVLAKDDSEGLVDACCTLIDHPELRQKLGAAGKQFVAEHFSVEKMVNATVAFYDERALVRS